MCNGKYIYKIKHEMKTSESLSTDCKNQTRKIVVKFYLWEKFKVAGCWEIFSGLGKKKGGESETKNQCSDSLRLIQSQERFAIF